MSGMNSFLANLYGTGVDDDVEKLAHAEALDTVLQSHGVGIDDLSSVELLKVAENLWGPGNPIEKLAEEAVEEAAEDDEDEDEDEEEEEIAEKMAEADLLGRVMAHAQFQEMERIKEASGGYTLRNGVHIPEGLASSLDTPAYHRAGSAIKRTAGRAGSAVKRNPKKSAAVGAGLGTLGIGALAGRAVGRSRAAAKRSRRLKGLGLGAAGLGALGLGAAAMKRKESAAVENRYAEILAELGYV